MNERLEELEGFGGVEGVFFTSFCITITELNSWLDLEKLSNDEVEALLSGLDSESKEDGTQQFDPNEVREFKFGTEDLSLLGDYYALRMINEKICRFTRSVFLPMLRIMPQFHHFPEVKSFDEYVESCDNFVSVTNSRIEELRGNALLVIEAPLFHILLTPIMVALKYNLYLHNKVNLLLQNRE